MVPGSSRSFLAGILLTQCGNPRAHCQEDVLHCASSHRFAGRVRDTAPVAEAEDKEVAQPCFEQRDSAEGWMVSEFFAEAGPGAKDFVSGCSSFGDKSGVSGVQRSAEISCEFISGRSERCCQGSGSG